MISPSWNVCMLLKVREYFRPREICRKVKMLGGLVGRLSVLSVGSKNEWRKCVFRGFRVTCIEFQIFCDINRVDEDRYYPFSRRSVNDDTVSH